MPCRFRLYVGGGDGVLHIRQSNAVSGSCDDAGPEETVFLGNGVKVGNASGSGSQEVRFQVPRAEPLDSAGSELKGGDSIGFRVSHGGTTRYVCVYPMGRIEEKDGGC